MVTCPPRLLDRLRPVVSLPVVMKEMRSRMRGSRAPVLLFVTTALCILVGLLVLAPQWGFREDDSPLAMSRQLAEAGQHLFIGLMFLEAGLCALIAPALTAGAISIEREQQTLDLLLLTRLTSTNIALGKLVSSLSFVGIILLCALPVGAISFVLGGVSPGQFCSALALVLAVVALFGAIGLYCSTRFRKTATAVVVAYTICLAWVGLIPLVRVLLEGFNSGISLTDEVGLILGILFTVGMLLLLAVVPAGIALIIITQVVRRRLSRSVHLAVWGLSAIAACLLLYLPDALDVFNSDYLLFGNPVVALLRVFDDTYAFSTLGAGTVRLVLIHLFVPLTVLLHTLFAWVACRFAVGELDRLRG